MSYSNSRLSWKFGVSFGRLGTLALLGPCLLLALTANASTINWTNTSGGSWSVPSNWSPHFVPGSTDTAVISAAGTYTVTIDTSVTISGLTLGGSGQQTLTNNSQNVAIAGSSVVNANGVFEWAGGTLSGGLMTMQGTFNWFGGNTQLPITVTGGAVMNIVGSGMVLEGPLTNAGAVNLSGGTLSVFNNLGIYNGVIQNQPGAFFNLQGNFNVACGCYGNEYFRNAGTVIKTAGSGLAVIGVVFTNTGTVDAESGTLAFNGGGGIASDYNTASGATIEFDVGNFTQTGPVTVTGAGVCRLNGATVTLLDRITKFSLFAGNVAVAPNFETNGTIQSLQLDGAYLVGTNSVTGTLGINGGGLGVGSALTVAPGGTLNFNGATASLYGPLTNAGTVNWSGSGIVVNNNNAAYAGLINNQSGALFNAQNDQNITAGGYGFEFFKNAGTVRKSAGIGATTLNIGFSNSGTIDAQTGTIRFFGGGNLAGTYNTASGTIIEFYNGSFTENGTVSITGTGVCRENGANVTLVDQIAGFQLISGNLSLAPNFETDGAIHSLQLDGVSLVGANVVVGTLGMDGGTVVAGGSLTVSNGATLNFNGAAVSINAPVTNAGTINWTGGNLFVNNNNGSLSGAVYNQSGAFFNALSDQSLSSGGYGGEFFRNAGTVRKSAGLGATIFGVAFTNSGTIDAQSGTIRFSGGGNLAGTYNTAAGDLIEFTGGFFTENGIMTITGGGICRQNGASVTLTGLIPVFSLLSGNVALTPNFEGDGAIHGLQLDGAMLVGTNVVTGTLTMNGGGVQSGSALTIAAGGYLYLSGSSITLNGPLTNAGTINWSSPNCAIFVDNNTNSLTGLLYNRPGGLINISTDQGVSSGGYGGEQFRNDGTIRKSVALGTSSISIPFTNTGLIDAQSGTIRFAGAYSAIGGTMNFGITSLAYFGQITFSANAPLTGTVSANLNGTYSPSIGDSFPVLTYASSSGMFADAVLPLPAEWGTNYGTTTFTITVTNVTTVSVPTLVTLTPVSYVGGHFTLQIHGPLGPPYALQASSNLVNWISLVTNTPGAMPFSVTDSNASGFPHRFYRALMGP